MDTIEMTDADGDALSVISRDHLSWISCTSEDAEVTVGPFPSRFLHGALARSEAESGASAPSAGHEHEASALPAPEIRELAWAEFQRMARTESLRTALDAALEAAMGAAPANGAGTPDAGGYPPARPRRHLRRA